MSFGASGTFRLEPGQNEGKPGIFYQTGSHNRPAKKFSYKKKDLRYPLRRADQQTDEVVHTQVDKENRKNNRPNKDFLKQNRDKLSRSKDPLDLQTSAKDKSGGYYTLTHEQLNSILKSVGKIASLRGDGVNIAIEQSLKSTKLKAADGKDPITSELKIEQSTEEDTKTSGEEKRGDEGNNGQKEENDTVNDDRKKTEIILNSVRSDESTGGRETGDGDGRQTRTVRQSRTSQTRDGKIVPDSSRGGGRKSRKGKSARKTIDESKEKDESNNAVSERSEVTEVKSNPRFSPPPISRSHMTKAEKLRMELQQGKEESGRTGAVVRPQALGDHREGERAVPKERNPITQSVDQDTPTMKFHIPPLIPKAHLTMAEKKRLQWEIERGETINTPPSKKDSDTGHSPQRNATRLVNREAESSAMPGSGTVDQHPIGGEMISPRSILVPRPPLSQAEKKKIQWQIEREESERTGAVVRLQAVGDHREGERAVPKERNPITQSVDQDTPTMKFHIPPLIPKAHLTMAEKKRLQWEIERGETINTPPSKKDSDTGHSPQRNATRLVNREAESSAMPGSGTVDQHPIGGEMISPRSILVPRPPLSQAEKKKIQWQIERAEQQKQGEFNPFGKPGAGAPIRTNSGRQLVDFKTRKDQVDVVRSSVEGVPTRYDPVIATTEQPHNTIPPAPPTIEPSNSPPQHTPRMLASQQQQHAVPAAMRSSFAIGHVAPDDRRFTSTKDDERRKWLEDLEKQKEENRLQKMLEKEKDRQYFQETWADKLTYDKYQPTPLPEQTSSTTPRGDTSYRAQTEIAPTPRVNSAPQPATAPNLEEEQNFIRGQNALQLDPATKRELEEKKKRSLEHHAAVMAQVEEKQRLKRREREHRIEEEREEERKLQQERDFLQKQYDLELKKSKVKEDAREKRVQALKEVMDQSHLTAQQEKYSRRMQHLQEGGHDIKRLQANIEANLTPRPPVTVVAPTSVPGLDLTPRPSQSHLPHPPGPPHAPSHRETDTDRAQYHHEPYTEDRVLTPSVYRSSERPVGDPLSPNREFGTQTDMNFVAKDSRHDSADSIVYKGGKQRVSQAQGKKVRVRSANKEENVSDNLSGKPPKGKKGPLKITERPKWGVQSTKQKKPTKQSEKDPFYEKRKHESEERRAKREQQLLALVEANKRVIPTTTKSVSSRSRDQSPEFDDGPHYYESGTVNNSHRGRFVDNVNSETNMAIRSRHRSERAQSPPLSTRHNNERSPGRSRSPQILNSHHESRRARTRNKYQAGGNSPPVPALKHKRDIWKETNEKNLDNDYDLEAHNFTNYHPALSERRKAPDTHYEDDMLGNYPMQNGDFVPFMRTSEILDPSRSAAPVIVSRESSSVAHARQAYYKGQRPGEYGNQLENFDDSKYQVMPVHLQMDPIMNPNVVKGHPTPRQDIILQQLSSLKQSLMRRQREIETCMSPSDLNNARDDYS